MYSIYYAFTNIYSQCYRHIPIKNTVLLEIRSKGAGKALLLKIENKILL